MKNMNESLLESISLIEESVVEAELNTLFAMGNEYTKIALLTEYADEEVLNEYEIVQEAFIMEAKEDKKDDKEGKSKEGIIAKLKKAMEFIKSIFTAIGRWFKTKFSNFVDRFRKFMGKVKNKKKEPDPILEKLEEETKELEHIQSSMKENRENNDKIIGEIKESHKKFNEYLNEFKEKIEKEESSDEGIKALEIVVDTLREANDKIMGELEKGFVGDLEDKLDNLISDSQDAVEKGKKNREEIEKKEQEKKEITAKNVKLVEELKSNMVKIIEQFNQKYKHNMTTDQYKEQADMYSDEIRAEFEKAASAIITRVSPKIGKSKSNTGVQFIRMSDQLDRDIWTVYNDICRNENDNAKTRIRVLREETRWYKADIDLENNDVVLTSIDDINSHDINKTILSYKDPEKYEDGLKLVQNELNPLVSKISSDMISYNMALMKAYETVAKKHGYEF